MKNKILISIILSNTLYSQNINLADINVVEKVDSINLNDVSGQELKSADLGEALSKKDPDIVISRRSGIANDIILRGFKKDNINIIIDGGKIYGGCPNRMDPPISHVVTSNINSVIVNEGPYDVENFGTLGGNIKVDTKAPKSGFSGEANLNIGSFAYQKGSLTMQGGDQKVKALITISKEKSKQYKDGNGDKFDAQLKKAKAPLANRYQPQYIDMDAFSKKSFLGKLYFNLNNNQKLKFSYTANRSDDVLYPNTPMDALKDDSDLYNFQYTIKNLSIYSKKLDFLYYYSKVVHPMSTRYKRASKIKGEVENDMLSKIAGGKIKNSFLFNNSYITYGLDYSKRTWDGYYNNGKKSIPNAITKNRAAFLDISSKVDKNSFRYGLRYDKSNITNDRGLKEPDFNSLNGYIFDSFDYDDSMSFFGGVGIAHRVPDGRELYFMKKGNLIGTPTLNQTKNSEIDLGVKKNFENSEFKLKLFYSRLSNYIYFNNDLPKNKFVNIDAKIYGVKLSGLVMISDEFNFDYGISYLKGKKDSPLVGQTDTDLADITPLRGIFTLNYEPDMKTKASFELIAQKSWTSYDGDNGEQRISGFAIVNTKYQTMLNHSWILTLGMDNIFDKTYQSSNTYNDLTLVMTGGGKKIGLNNPGRYGYINLTYKF